MPTPGHCVCAKVSHSVGTRGRPRGGGQLGTARSPALQTRPGCLPLPSFQSQLTPLSSYPTLGRRAPFGHVMGCLLRFSLVNPNTEREGEGL